MKETIVVQERRNGFWIGGGGGRGASKQVPETLTCRGFWRNSSPENFEILKLGNATFSILEEIRGSTVKSVFKCLFFP